MDFFLNEKFILSNWTSMEQKALLTTQFCVVFKILNIHSTSPDFDWIFFLAKVKRKERKGREKRHPCQIHLVHNQSDKNVRSPFQKECSIDVNKFPEHSKTHHTDTKTFFFYYSKFHAKDLERSSDRWPVWRALFCMKLRVTWKTSLCPCCAFCSS